MRRIDDDRAGLGGDVARRGDHLAEVLRVDASRADRRDREAVVDHRAVHDRRRRLERRSDRLELVQAAASSASGAPPTSSAAAGEPR